MGLQSQHLSVWLPPSLQSSPSSDTHRYGGGSQLQGEKKNYTDKQLQETDYKVNELHCVNALTLGSISLQLQCTCALGDALIREG